MLNILKSGMRRVFPDHTARGRTIRAVASRMGLSHDLSWSRSYATYILSVEPESFFPPVTDHEPGDSPFFSVVVPFFNTPDKYLFPLLDSLASQSFQDWELIMVDASTNEARARIIESQSHTDPRFRYVRLHENKGISWNTNQALPHVGGKFVVFADHDDTLSPHALNEMFIAIEDHPDVDILYSDEDVLSDDGRMRKGPFFKPSWSPHMFLEMNYTNHLSVIKTDLVRQVGGLRPERDGAQDYDLLLRIHALPRLIRVVHVPKILYHWREAEHSTARTISTKTYALDAGQSALMDYLEAIGVEHGGVEHLPGRPGWYRTHPRQKCTAEVIVMVSDDQRVNNQFMALLQSRTRCAWVNPTFTSLYPDADVKAHCASRNEDVVVTVRAMFLPDEEMWLDELAGVLALPQTAAVTPLLMGNMFGHLINSGLMEKSGTLQPLYRGCDVSAGGSAGPPDLVRDVDGVSPNVVAFPRDTAHRELFLDDDIDGRDWNDLLVVWGYTRFTLKRFPYKDRRLNDNLALSGPTVVLRNDIEFGLKTV